MKIKKSTITIAFILITFLSYSQDRIAVSMFQDAKLLFVGDNKGNESGTLNVVIRGNLQSEQQRFGFIDIFPELEFANLKGGNFQRYSLNVGYIFNRLGGTHKFLNHSILNNVEIGSSVGYGFINRQGFSFLSWSFSGVLNYEINNTFKITTQLQSTQRTDLKQVVFRFSGFIGIQVKILQYKTTK